MQRKYAEIGSVFKLYDSDGVARRFTITEIKGEGASCLVYGAKSSGGMKSVIKEFFPLLSQEYSFERTDSELFIEKSITVTEDFLLKEHRFVSSVSLTNKLAFSEETAEETLPAELLTNNNGIPYILTEWNPQRVSCYENVKTASLNEIATVCLNLSEITSAYHSMGLVHLDIKPSNILWSKKYRYVKLFDFDTITSPDNSGQFFKPRGTDGFDAPEVADHSMINNKSDVYSIGAILFERVMDRTINSAAGDRVNFGYEKTLSDMPLIAGESPEAAALVKTILRGTICAAPGRRMNIDKLKELLSQLVRLTKADEPESAKNSKVSFIKNHKAVIAVLSCGALLLVGGTIFALSRQSDNSVPISGNVSSVSPQENSNPETAPQTTSSEISESPSHTEHTTVSASETPEQELIPSEGFSYTFYDDGIELTEYNGKGGKVIIPQSIDGYNVVKLGDNLFSSREDITEFVIPEGIRELGSGVFWFCTRLSEIKLPDSLEIIRSNALYGLWGVREVFIPENVFQIDTLTFGGWSGFERIEVAESNRHFCSADGVLYNKRKTKLIFYPPYKADSEFTIPDAVIYIDTYAFDRPKYLEKLNFPADISYIDPNQIFGSVKEFTLEPSNGYYTLYDGALFSKNMDSLLAYPAGSPRSEWTVPESVKRLECGCITLARNLKTLIIQQMPEYISEVSIMDFDELYISYNNSLYTPEEFYRLYSQS